MLTNATRSRRQYIYHLDEWGICKYKVDHTKKSDSNEASNGKRKRADDWAEQDDEQLNSSSTQASPSHKKSKMEEQYTIAPDEEPDITKVSMPRSMPRSMPQSEGTALVVTRARSNSQPMPPPHIEPISSLASSAFEFWSSVENSKSAWYAGQGNSKIAHEISCLARKARLSQESVWDHNAPVHVFPYLKDIGEYLCGIKQGREAFDIYALMLESFTKRRPSGEELAILLSCVHSTDSSEGIWWIASYLKRLDKTLEHSEATCDVLILVRLFLASKYVIYGSQIEAKKHASEAWRLERNIRPRFWPRKEPSWSAIATLQYEILSNFYNPRDLANSGLYELLGQGDHSSWTSESEWLKSVLFGYCKVIKERKPNAVAAWRIGDDENVEETDHVTLSATFFRLIWRTQYDELPAHLDSVSAAKTRQTFQKKEYFIPLPHFVGVCCDILAHEAKQHQRGGATKNLTFWRDSSRHPDMVDVVWRMDASKLLSQFVNCYCDRELGSGLTCLPFGLPDNGFWNLRPDRVNMFTENVSFIVTSTLKDSRAGNIPAGIPRFVAGIRNYELPRLAIPAPSEQQLRPESERFGPYLDPTLRSSCRSSFSSFRHFIEARSAMARSRKQTAQCPPIEGEEGSLPSNVPGIEELRFSMENISLFSQRSA
ncbi:hypothetical protein PG996_010618 [Apiospora saccharicola]|uniref:Uncharacterized protein n=1 Tax=Apiospora saccharicola TaxID=335842 RepID=A0ABR1UP32_9PEZI